MADEPPWGRFPTAAFAAAGVAVAVLVPTLVTSPYYSGILVLCGVYALLGLSVNLVFGYLGYLSFGHAGFFGLGAYTTALLVTKLGVGFWLAAAIATLPCAALGALVGFASLRVGGAYFAIASLTVAEILRLVADNWIDLTRGPMGLVIGRPTIGWLEAGGVEFRTYYLGIVLLVLAVVLLGHLRLNRSPEGRSWLAVRESLDLAESVGVPTLRVRVKNLALSGGLAGLAGALLIPQVLVLSPDLFGPTISA
ncbi:MAG: branched-chain amino acid ABC transporter permease, partial [Isosphaeraceae bacterium]